MDNTAKHPPLPRVSIVMAAFNAEPYIGQAIESALAQTEPSLEVIVVDDGSSDGTPAVVDRYAARDPRIRLIESRMNLGPGHARNLGIDAARGEWIAILDADDWYEPNRLEILLSAAGHDGAPIVADNQYFMLDGADRPYRLLRPQSPDGAAYLSAEDMLHGDTLGRTGNLGLLKPVIRRQFLSDHNISYDVSIGLGEDFYILLKCLRHSPHLLFMTRPLYNYRVHKQSWSNSLTRNAVAAIRELHDRNAGLFDSETAPTAARLMARRRRQIDRYIRYRTLVDPLKRGDLRRSLQRGLANPTALPLLAQGLYRHLSRHRAIDY